MTGYPESLTDPSYQGQILVLTYPSIGNYGVPGKTLEDGMLQNFESENIHTTVLLYAGLIFYQYGHLQMNLSNLIQCYSVGYLRKLFVLLPYSRCI